MKFRVGSAKIMGSVAVAAFVAGVILGSCKRRSADDNPIPMSARAKKGSYPEWSGRRVFPCECVGEVPNRDGGVWTVSMSAGLCEPADCDLGEVCRALGRETGFRCQGTGAPRRIEYQFEASACKTDKNSLCKPRLSPPEPHPTGSTETRR